MHALLGRLCTRPYSRHEAGVLSTQAALAARVHRFDRYLNPQRGKPYYAGWFSSVIRVRALVARSSDGVAFRGGRLLCPPSPPPCRRLTSAAVPGGDMGRYGEICLTGAAIPARALPALRLPAQPVQPARPGVAYLPISPPHLAHICPYLPRCNLPGPEWLSCLSRGPFDARITTPALLFTVPFASTDPDKCAGIIDGVSLTLSP